VRFEQFLSDWLRQMQWGDQEYLREHIRGIAQRIHADLSNRKALGRTTA
jgi:hypothetical protein